MQQVVLRALHASGRKLSAFLPPFHSSPPQWPGVYTLSGEEEAAADAGFKAAGRASAGLVELQLCGLEFAVRWGQPLLVLMAVLEGSGRPQCAAHRCCIDTQAARELKTHCLTSPDPPPAAAASARALTPECTRAWTATARMWP